MVKTSPWWFLFTLVLSVFFEWLHPLENFARFSW